MKEEEERWLTHGPMHVTLGGAFIFPYLWVKLLSSTDRLHVNNDKIEVIFHNFNIYTDWLLT